MRSTLVLILLTDERRRASRHQPDDERHAASYLPFAFYLFTFALLTPAPPERVGGLHAFDHLLNAVGHVLPSLIFVRPVAHGRPTFGDGLQLRELRNHLPLGGADDDGDDPRLSLLVPFERAAQLFLVAVIRIDEVGADEQQNDVGAFEVGVDLLAPVLARFDGTVVPRLDEVQPPQRAEVRLQFVEQPLVPVRVADEDARGALALQTRAP